MSANDAIGRSVSVGGIETNYHDDGKGAPVLLLHGSAPGVSAWANWRKTTPVLREQYRTLSYDIPGFGYTARSEDYHLGMKFWVQHAIGFLDAMKLEKVHIVGNSFGGALGLAVAIFAPERVEKLVLMGSGGLSRPVSDGLKAVWQYQPSVENMRGLLERFVYDNEILTDELVEARFEASQLPLSDLPFQALRRGAVEENGVLMTAGVPEETVTQVKHDTLILHGREDEIMPCDIGIALNEMLHNSDLHIFGKCGHWVQIEQHEKFHALVLDFLK